MSVFSSNRTNEHVHTPWDVLPPILQVLHCASTCFSPSLSSLFFIVSFFDVPPAPRVRGRDCESKGRWHGEDNFVTFLEGNPRRRHKHTTQPPHSPSSTLIQQQQLVLCILCRLEEMGRITQDPYFTSHGEAKASAWQWHNADFPLQLESWEDSFLPHHWTWGSGGVSSDFITIPKKRWWICATWMLYCH